MDPFAYKGQRTQMVASQILRRGVCDPRLLDVLRLVPRHCFVSQDQADLAYEDYPLPIGEGQTISQPFIVALMTNLLALKESDIVLEIGTGSGYQAAVLSLMAKRVFSIERHAVLASRARDLFRQLGYNNIVVQEGDGTLGLAETAPFQGILVTAAAPRPPEPLFEQLAEGGRLVIPVGGSYHQDLQLWQRKEHSNFTCSSILPVTFVPLLGKHGWNESTWRTSEV
jgi:protein-L-isoaspartate(D-aspartate) O-methyltransferase